MKKMFSIPRWLYLSLLIAPYLTMAEPGDDGAENFEKKEVVLTKKQCEILNSPHLDERVVRSKKNLTDLMIGYLLALPSTVLWTITTHFNYKYHARVCKNLACLAERMAHYPEPLWKRPWLFPPLVYGVAGIPLWISYQKYRELKSLKKIKMSVYYSIRCEEPAEREFPHNSWDG